MVAYGVITINSDEGTPTRVYYRTDENGAPEFLPEDDSLNVTKRYFPASSVSAKDISRLFEITKEVNSLIEEKTKLITSLSGYK